MFGEIILFILKSGLITVILAVLSFLSGLALAVVVTVLSMIKIKPVNAVAWVYIQLIRGTPLLMQMFFVFFALPQFGIQWTIFESAFVALTLNTSAFMAEIIRTSILSVPNGQWDAAKSMALSNMQTLIKIIIPQAVRIAIPPTIGYITNLVKNTSVASTIGLIESTRAGRLMTEQSGQGLIIFAIVGVLYFIICYPISKLSKRIEKGFEK